MVVATRPVPQRAGPLQGSRRDYYAEVRPTDTTTRSWPPRHGRGSGPPEQQPRSLNDHWWC